MTTINLGRVVGENGEDGRGIVSITKTGTSGLVDTYTITYTDNTTSTFEVTNGSSGSGGTSNYNELSNKPSINSVELSGNKSLSDLGVQAEIDSTHKLSADNVDDTNTTNKFVTASDKSTWSGKQDALVSGTNIKTINNQSLLGSGNITIQGGGSTGLDIESLGNGLVLSEQGELSVDFSKEDEVLFDYDDLIPYYVNADGTITASDTALCSELVLLEQGKTYILTSDITGTTTNQGIRVRIYDEDGTFLLAPTQQQYDNNYLRISPSNTSYPYNSQRYDLYAKATVKIRVMFMDKTKITEAELSVPGTSGSVGKICAVDDNYNIAYEDFDTIATNKFRGKSLGMIGDSISAGQYATEAYSAIIAEKLGMTLTNASVPGNTLSQIYNQIANLPATLDVVLVMGGTNNYKQSGDEGVLGTLYDSSTKALNTDNTVCGWFNKILTALRNKYPKALICILTPPKSTNNVSVSSNPYDFLDLNNAIKQISELHSVPCFDVCGECPINSWNEESAKVYYTHIWSSGEYSGQRDISHPTDKGQQAIADYIIGKLFTYSGGM